ncbi:MAG: 50S ribosomal protein L29 [Candidatus Hecatellales archaeon]|nr:MAG: 50S ribosomal protein L29 [Candidatus Hecatellales archaeon]
MAILRMSEIRSMGREEREKKLSELRVELMKLKTQVRAKGTLENPKKIREIRKTIARILTVQKEEELKERGEGGRK